VRLLSDECQERLAIGNGVLENTIQQLLNGSISFGKLKVLTAGISNFLEVYRVVEKNAQSDVFNVPDSGIKDLNKSAVLQKVISWRQIEQRNVESLCVHLSHFIIECGNIQSG